MNKNIVSQKEINQLSEYTSQFCVSIYVPTDPINSDALVNKIAFKNAAHTAIKKLEALEITGNVYDRVRETCDNLIEDTLFWKKQSRTFVLLIGNIVKSFSLTTEHPEIVMISDHFYITPLITELQKQTTFYILEVDKEHTGMWQGNENSLVKVDVPYLPKSVEEVTGTEMNERGLQSHSGSSNLGGKNEGIFHGSSSWQDDHDRYLEKFIQAADKAVTGFFKDHKQYSLFLSGTEEPVVMFKKIFSNTEAIVSIIPKVTDPSHKEKVLHDQALAILTPLNEQIERLVLERFAETKPERKTTVLPEVLRQISQGKVDTLLIAEDTQKWGVFDPETMNTIIRDKQELQSTELLNLAARLTLQNSGKVTILPLEEMPDEGEIAAILRY